jgi:4-hydroxybutyrate CoA-transferase
MRPVRALLVALVTALALQGAPVAEAARGGNATAAAQAVRAKKVKAAAGKRTPGKARRGSGEQVAPRAWRQTAARRPGKTPRERTAAQIAGQIRPGSVVYLPIGHSVSRSVVTALVARAKRDTALSPGDPIRIFGLTNVASRKLYTETGGKIIARSVFIGSNNRDSIASGQGEFIPTHLSRVPRLMREGKVKIDVAIIQVSPPDKNGYVSLGSSTGTSLAAMESARTVIAEVNPNVPKTYGAARIHKSRIDFMVKSNEPLVTIEPVPISDIDRAIAANVQSLIPDNPTIQFGIGSTTDAIAGALADSGRRDIRIHSEMISDGTMNLIRSGAVKGPVHYTFALGSQRLLDWMNGNKQLQSRPVDVLNDPRRLALIPRLVSINTALRIDLNGQANAQYVGDRHYSGTGGQQDFFRGAMLSEGGKAIMVLPSTSTVKDTAGNDRMVSRIVMALGEEDVVTTGMHDLQYVVTEYGVAHLEGKSTIERARALIEVAHPAFRAGLRVRLIQLEDKRKRSVQERQP